jgi:hypothetical protein
MPFIPALLNRVPFGKFNRARAKHGAFWHVFVMITVSRVDSSVRRIRRTRELSGEQSRYHLLCMKVNKK